MTARELYEQFTLDTEMQGRALDWMELPEIIRSAWEHVRRASALDIGAEFEAWNRLPENQKITDDGYFEDGATSFRDYLIQNEQEQSSPPPTSLTK